MKMTEEQKAKMKAGSDAYRAKKAAEKALIDETQPFRCSEIPTPGHLDAFPCIEGGNFFKKIPMFPNVYKRYAKMYSVLDCFIYCLHVK